MTIPKRRRQTFLFFAMLGGAFLTGALWTGLVPPRFLPFPTLDLEARDSWFVDLRLAAMKNDPERCLAVLRPPAIAAVAVKDSPIRNGCGWANAFSVSRAGEARLAVDKMTCDLAAAFAMWMAHSVQPAAARLLNSRVASIRHMGVYACRNIQGSRRLGGFRSQHARANAIDVSAFALADGRTISVLHHWKGKGAEAEFLHTIHDEACRYFRVALGPDFNAAHANHFHLDRGAFRSCR